MVDYEPPEHKKSSGRDAGLPGLQKHRSRQGDGAGRRAGGGKTILNMDDVGIDYRPGRIVAGHGWDGVPPGERCLFEVGIIT